MTRIEKIANILDAHGIEHYTRNGRIYEVERFRVRVSGYAYGDPDSFREEVEEIDVTDWTKRELLNWLGYDFSDY